jgi:hypothetical protein
MKHFAFTSSIASATALAVLIIVAVPLLPARQVATATPFYKPGDTIRLSVTLEGSDLDDILAVHANLQGLTETPHGQKGFQTTLNGGESKRVSPTTFTVELKVPDLISDGDYRLLYIQIDFKTNQRPSAYYYVTLREIPELHFQIRNPKHFENPIVKTITEEH